MHIHDSTSQRLAVGLAALAGFIDALGFLSLGGVFVSFMSGNSTRFAVDLAGGDGLRVALLPLGIIALFVIGVMLGRLIRHMVRQRPSTAILVFMSLTLALAAVLQGMGLLLWAAPCLAIAMGAANNVFFREGEVSIGVTYMTGTLVKFGQRLAGRLLGDRQSRWAPYLMLWAGLVSGAVAGAWGYMFYGLAVLWAGVGLCLLLAFCFSRTEKVLPRTSVSGL